MERMIFSKDDLRRVAFTSADRVRLEYAGWRLEHEPGRDEPPAASASPGTAPAEPVTEQAAVDDGHDSGGDSSTARRRGATARPTSA